MKEITVRVPASTANLGPGFDSIGLALSIWNQAIFRITGDDVKIYISGEGADTLPSDQGNLVLQAFKKTCQHLNQPLPAGLEIDCTNQIPLGSGMGSSGSATLLGILGANALLNNRLENDEIIQLGSEIEGHADNLTASLLGGLTISAKPNEKFYMEKLKPFPWQVCIVLSDIELSTEASRKALPGKIPFSDAQKNIGNSLLLVQALQNGDLALLREAMQDKLHQPYRLPLLPGAEAAIAKANELGWAAGLSGAGPSLIALGKKNRNEIGEAMSAQFKAAGYSSRIIPLEINQQGAQVS